MDIIKVITDNKEWIFSGVGVATLVGIITYIYNYFHNTSDLITVTIAGGAYLGPSSNTPKTINKNDISSLDDPYSNEIGTTVIVMKDGTKYYVTETKSKLKRLTRK